MLRRSRAPRKLVVAAVAALLLFYVLLAAWFTRDIIAGRPPHIDAVVFPPGQPATKGAAALVAGEALKRPQGVPDAPKPTEADQPKLHPNDDIHVVFSTGCNYFQHWQAEVLLHSHLLVGQRGQITRVVSGCDTENVKRKHAKFLTHPEGLADETVPLEELQKSSHPRMRLHVTPSFEGAREFPWINKPMGLHHWLMHADPPVTESVIVIIDPDMFFMDTFTQDGSKSVKGAESPYGEDGLLCTDGCSRGKWRGENIVGFTEKVIPGRPVAQMYGLGGEWARRLNISGMAGADSPAAKLTVKEASLFYAVGPPMMLHLSDLKKVMPLWVKFMYPVFEAMPGDIQADMYAYSIACAHLKLPHVMYDNFMVSSPNTRGEAWPFVRQYPHIPCSDPNKYAKFKPTMLHIAQRYDSQLPFMFHKGHVPPNILKCDLPLIKTPPEDLVDTATSYEQKDKNYMLCCAYKLINSAVLAWKKKFCPDGYLDSKEIMLQKHSPRCPPGSDGKTCWVFAKWDKSA